MTAFIDTNVLIRHLIGEPVDQAEQATRTLSLRETLLLSDIVIAETIYVLQKVYSVDRPTISDVMKSLIAFPSIQVVDEPTVLRALETAPGYQRAQDILLRAVERRRQSSQGNSHP